MNSWSEIEPELSLSKIWKTRWVKKGYRNDRAVNWGKVKATSVSHILGNDDFLEVILFDFLSLADGLLEQLLQSLERGFVESSLRSGVSEIGDAFDNVGCGNCMGALGIWKLRLDKFSQEKLEVCANTYEPIEFIDNLWKNRCDNDIELIRVIQLTPLAFHICTNESNVTVFSPQIT